MRLLYGAVLFLIVAFAMLRVALLATSIKLLPVASAVFPSIIEPSEIVSVLSVAMKNNPPLPVALNPLATNPFTFTTDL